MTNIQLKETLEIIELCIKIIGIGVGATWVYFKFITTRENHPKIEFNVGVNFIGRQDNKILIEVIAELENKGLVRHWVNNLTCDVLILNNNDPIEHGDRRINNQVLFKKYNPEKGNNQRITWIPENWYKSFIDPGIKQQYTYITSVPDTTTFISIYSQFFYKNKDFQTSQRTFSVQ